MNDIEKQQRFVLLRAEGWSFARIADELGISKPTLINWSRKFQFQIQNLKAIEMEALQQKWLASTTSRIDAFGEQLRKIEAELAQRNVADLTTPQLHTLARSLRREIEQATGPFRFTTPVSEIPAGEFQDQVQDWQG